ncbi:methyl-accepting chemotaxis protein [Clostridium hydrogenum]|uniref:methyl-accepting chemotaxis protein n=1 Tax=Clostridium hydrogenum TaxID=2855764 RepID=UPI001F21CE58|nr:methyl-accepting chemotaxis protein [Clostridium hydrogenum]
MRSIKSKITLVICLVCALGLILSSAVTYYISYNSITQESKEKFLQTSNKYAETINGWFDGQGKIINEMANHIEFMGDLDNKSIMAYFQRELQSNTYASDVYIGFSNKKIIVGSGWIPPADFDCTQRDWYKSAIEKNGLVYSSPFLDAKSKQMMISVAKPVTKNGEVIGVIGCDLKLSSITSILEKAKIADGSYAFLLDSNNNILVHPNKAFKPTEKGLQNIKNVMNGKYLKLLSSNYVKLKDYNGEEKYFIKSKVSVNNWTVGFSIPVKVVMKPINTLILSFIVIIVITQMIAILISMYFGRKLTYPIICLSEMVNKISRLDLTYDDRHDFLLKYKDETGRLAKAFKVMNDEFAGLIKEIKNGSEDISATSEELSATTEELTSKFASINEATKNISEGIQETSASSQEISAAIEEVNSGISNLSEKALEGRNVSSQSKQRAMKIRDKGEISIERTRDIYKEKRQRVLESIEEAKVVENIKAMAETIAGISEQTNLLSLNASIEAARAGEHGKGFAVVADEVGKLAHQTSESVIVIQNTIEKLENVFKHSSDNSNDMLEFINKNVDPQFEDFQNMANQYYNDSNFVDNMSEKISTMSEEIDSAVGQVSFAIQNMAVSAQKSSEHAEVIEQSMDETVKAVEQVSKTAQNQAELAEKLNEMVIKFKI